MRNIIYQIKKLFSTNCKHPWMTSNLHSPSTIPQHCSFHPRTIPMQISALSSGPCEGIQQYVMPLFVLKSNKQNNFFFLKCLVLRFLDLFKKKLINSILSDLYLTHWLVSISIMYVLPRSKSNI